MNNWTLKTKIMGFYNFREKVRTASHTGPNNSEAALIALVKLINKGNENV